ncbi:MAG TPA: hypothetical protein DD979_01835 [Gammaproteobacteria bacterium]|nr:hypothetical protein [Gammaproteobacteria bacterium]
MDEIALTLKPIESAQLEHTLAHFDQRRMDFGLLSRLKYGAEKYLPEMRLIEHRYPEIAAYLKFLEQQLEVLSSHIGGCAEAAEALHRQQVELSAVGVRFTYPKVLDVGSHVETTLVLFPQQIRILMIMKLVRVEPQNDGSYAVSGEFVCVHEEDREALIKHVHRRQIEELRRDSAS